MHICYVADARSPIAKNWISYFVRNHRVTVISSYPCRSDEIPGARILQIPLAFSSFTSNEAEGDGRRKRWLTRFAARFRTDGFLNAATQLRYRLAAGQIQRKSVALAQAIDEIRPDLIHAMRLPFEGFVAAATRTSLPLAISVWGNDFTLFANGSRKLGQLTNLALARADGLHCDCRRDLNIAVARGYNSEKPSRVLPGSGGVQTNFYFRAEPDWEFLASFGVPRTARLVINPRGPRAYVRNDTFFRAIPRVLDRVPDAFFLAVGLKGKHAAERWVRRLKIQHSVCLLPSVSREQLAGIFAASELSVSPSSYDGTPNTLLEAMACGCLPVAGDIDSIREWIADGKNGLLCDEQDPASLTSAMIRGLEDRSLRNQARDINRHLILKRADYATNMAQAEKFYEEVIATAYRHSRASAKAAACLSRSKCSVT
jgi:glycosyltransferase involved in cell wall biosynthesis